jgi:formate dehydrogenase subunit beta
MKSHWSLDTHGDPLGTVREVIKALWLQAGLAGMLVTMPDEGEVHVAPRFITDPAYIDRVNPFMPLMEMNIARMIPGIIAEHPGTWVGALLRPCELRALIEMAKHTSLDLGNFITFSVDCLGTLPADEYQWRLERTHKPHQPGNQDVPGNPDELANEALKFARQGGVVPYRFRPACQVCISPSAGQADVNLFVLGLPVRQNILLSISAGKLPDNLDTQKLTLQKTDQSLIFRHEQIVERMIEQHTRTIQRVNDTLGDQLPEDVEAVIKQLTTCGDCQACMDVCPICSVDRPYQDANGSYNRNTVMRWLISCAGCGMCEQACPNHLPTAAIFAHIRQQLDQEWEYLPGRSIDDKLPGI